MTPSSHPWEYVDTSKYTKNFFLTFDTSELKRYIKKLEHASRDRSVASKYNKAISPVLILRKSAPTALAELIKHTPSGEEGSNWGAWDYDGYSLHGGDHSKNTLKRGWVTKLPAMAEYKAFWLPTIKDAEDFVEGNVYVKRNKHNVHYLDLENCLEYATYVEYGHYIVLPGEKSESISARGGSRATRAPHKNSPTVNRWVMGKFFVAGMPKSSWNRVNSVMHEEYLKQLIRVLRND